MWPLDLLHDSAWRPLTGRCCTSFGRGWPLPHCGRSCSGCFRPQHANSLLLGLAGMFVMAACPWQPRLSSERNRKQPDVCRVGRANAESCERFGRLATARQATRRRPGK